MSEAILAFKSVESGPAECADPAWSLWKDLPLPPDTRNLSDKIHAVCPDASPSDLATWSRRAAQSLLEQRNFRDNKGVLALKYQIFDACEEQISSIRNASPQNAVPCEKVVEWMTTLCDIAKVRFEDCSKQYTYPIKADTSAKSIVYDLFDSCFLSFDGGRSS